MRCQRPLPVGGSLRCPENLLDIPAQAPRARPRRFCEAHLAKHDEACNVMSYTRPRSFARRSLRGIPRDGEILRPQVRNKLLSVFQESAVDRGEPFLGDLAAFRLGPIQFRAVPQLAGAQVRRDTPNTLLNILAA